MTFPPEIGGAQLIRNGAPGSGGGLTLIVKSMVGIAPNATAIRLRGAKKALILNDQSDNSFASLVGRLQRMHNEEPARQLAKIRRYRTSGKLFLVRAAASATEGHNRNEDRKQSKTASKARDEYTL